MKDHPRQIVTGLWACRVPTSPGSTVALIGPSAFADTAAFQEHPPTLAIPAPCRPRSGNLEFHASRDSKSKQSQLFSIVRHTFLSLFDNKLGCFIVWLFLPVCVSRLSLESCYLFFPPEDLNTVHLLCIGFQYIQFSVKNMYRLSEDCPRVVGIGRNPLFL